MSTPTTPQTTYFGDVNVYGNTTMSGTLAVLGTPALFYSNLGGTSLIGTQSQPFQCAWTTAANTTSVNFLTNIPGPVGVATSIAGASATIQGNVLVSTSVSTTNVSVTTSINTGSVMNVNFVTCPGGVGVGTNVVGTAALAVLGTMNAVASFQAANLILSGTLNVGAANIFSIATSNIGVQTAPVTGGAPLAVQGFASVSNAVSTTNVYATKANVGTLNTGSLASSSGFFGFGTAGASGTTAYVLGDLNSSNAINALVMTSNGLFASGGINVASVVAQSNVGVGVAPVQGGSALSVSGNVFFSNSFTTPNVFVGFMNVSNLSNIVTGLATSNVLIGPAADLYKGFNLAVYGNVMISNALQTTGVKADLINVGASANLLALVNAFAIGTTTLFPNAFMTINGNLYASNTATISIANTTRSNVTQNANAVTLTATSNVGIGTTPVAGGASLAVQGNLFASNALTAANVFATISANVPTLNTTSISTRFLGISTPAPSGTALYVPGNVYASNALTTTTIAVANSQALASNVTTISVSSNVGVGTAPVAGGAILAVQGNAFASNALTTTNVFATTSANVLTLNTGSIFTTASGFLGVGTSAASGTALAVSGNVYTSTAFVTTNVAATRMNVTGLANTTNFTMATGQFLGIGITTTGNALEVSGNAFVSDAVTAANVFSTLTNVGTLNTLSIFTQNSFLGIGTSAASGTAMFVQGNVYASTSTNTPAMFASNASVSLRGNALSVTSGTAFVVPTRYVAVAQATSAAAYSNDGITWVATTMPSVVNWQAVTVNPNTGRFVAIATTNTNSAAYSNDGINWFATTMPSGVNWQAVTVNPNTGRFVAIATTNTNSAAYSNDGITWVATSMPSGVNWQAVTVNPNTGRFVAIATTNTNSAAYSNDGINWFATTLPAARGWNSVTCNPVTGRFVTVATSSSSAAYSNDGITWVATSMPIATYWQAVTVNPNTGRFVAIAPSRWAAYSNDGINWVAATLPSVVTWQAVTTYYSVGAPSLSLLGNLYASNAVTTTNITATTANVTRVSNVTTLAQIPAISLGVSAGDAALNVRGNLVASNSVTTTNVYAIRVNTVTANVTSIFGPVGVGAAPSGPSLSVQGNLYASNALTIGGDIAAISMNLTSTLNTGSFTTAIIVASGLGWSNTNIFISNSITTTNVFTTNMNAASYVGTSGSIGINTSTGGYALQIQGNLASSNTLWSLPDVSAPTSIYYVDAITKRSPHLLPTPSNAAAIQSWISATCNAASQPTDAWWSTSATPVFGNAASGPGGNNDYCGGVLLPDGRVLFVPSSASNIGIFNPTSGEFSTIVPRGLTAAAKKYRGGILTPNGNVIFVPFQTNNVGVYNPINAVFSNIGPYNVGTNGFECGVLAPNGKAIFVPRSSANIGVFDWTSLTMSNVTIQITNADGFIGGCLLPNGNVVFIPATSANVGMLSADQSTFSNIGPFFTAGPTKFIGGVLAPNGNVIMTPGALNSANVAIFNPTNSTCSNVPTGVDGSSGGGAFQGAALLPSGNVIFAPCASANVGLFDPIAITYSNLVTPLDPSVGNKFYGATLIPDGRIVFTPMVSQNVAVLSTFTPAPVEFCLSPYFNKF